MLRKIEPETAKYWDNFRKDGIEFTGKRTESEWNIQESNEKKKDLLIKKKCGLFHRLPLSNAAVAMS